MIIMMIAPSGEPVSEEERRTIMIYSYWVCFGE